MAAVWEGRGEQPFRVVEGCSLLGGLATFDIDYADRGSPEIRPPVRGLTEELV